MQGTEVASELNVHCIAYSLYLPPVGQMVLNIVASFLEH